MHVVDLGTSDPRNHIERSGYAVTSMKERDKELTLSRETRGRG